mmetsp:Transcript_15882/g.34767  ORF Transcript_15882/g.34767 Transcript_15882/m.34767 type:complete len:209 (+) Transcript_15882:260-886(+)
MVWGPMSVLSGKPRFRKRVIAAVMRWSKSMITSERRRCCVTGRMVAETFRARREPGGQAAARNKLAASGGKSAKAPTLFETRSCLRFGELGRSSVPRRGRGEGVFGPLERRGEGESEPCSRRRGPGDSTGDLSGDSLRRDPGEAGGWPWLELGVRKVERRLPGEREGCSIELCRLDRTRDCSALWPGFGEGGGCAIPAGISSAMAMDF